MRLTEHGFEPIRGLPEALPVGEALLWQGAPRWRSLALNAFHLRGLAAYFLLLAAWRGWAAHSEGSTGAEVAEAVAWMALVGAVPLLLIAVFAVMVQRTTVYSLTTRRLVLRIGVALSVTINIPFEAIESAGLRLHADGTGDIALTLRKPHRIAWLMLWPHLRPWRMRDPEPMLRGLSDAAAAAQALARALSAMSPGVVTVSAEEAEAPLLGPGQAAAA